MAGGYACYQVYACRDGRYLSIGALEEHFWATLCHHLGADELIPLQWDAERRLEVLEWFRARFRERSRDEWWQELQDLQGPAS